jgi:hypothetical protein
MKTSINKLKEKLPPYLYYKYFFKKVENSFNTVQFPKVNKMKRFILITTSESSDHYQYPIQRTNQKVLEEKRKRSRV